MHIVNRWGREGNNGLLCSVLNPEYIIEMTRLTNRREGLLALPQQTGSVRQHFVIKIILQGVFLVKRFLLLDGELTALILD